MISMPSPRQRQAALILLNIIFLVWLWSLGDSDLLGPSPAMIPVFIFFAAGLIYWLLQTWGLWRAQPYLWWYGLGRSFLLVGVFGAIIGIMNVLNDLNSLEQIGPSLWISHFSVLWGLVLYLSCLGQAPLRKGYRSDGDMEVEASFVNNGLPILLFSVFVVLYVLKR